MVKKIRSDLRLVLPRISGCFDPSERSDKDSSRRSFKTFLFMANSCLPRGLLELGAGDLGFL